MPDREPSECLKELGIDGLQRRRLDMHLERTESVLGFDGVRTVQLEPADGNVVPRHHRQNDQQEPEDPGGQSPGLSRPDEPPVPDEASDEEPPIFGPRQDQRAQQNPRASRPRNQPFLFSLLRKILEAAHRPYEEGEEKQAECFRAEVRPVAHQIAPARNQKRADSRGAPSEPPHPHLKEEDDGQDGDGGLEDPDRPGAVANNLVNPKVKQARPGVVFVKP